MILVYSFTLRKQPLLELKMMPLDFAINTTNLPATASLQVASMVASCKTLADAAIGERFVVQKLLVSAGAPEWTEQLEDIGFIVGEPVTLMARAAFGGDPLVVRIGLSTFALRKAEAACVLVAAMKASA